MPPKETPLVSRRTFLAGTISGVASAVLLGHGLPAMALESRIPSEAFGIPGPFPGRVVEVRHPGSVVGDRVEREPVRDMVARGMRELTGAGDATEAWRRFFGPGDIVGIKVNPVGAPYAISSFALVHEVVAGLRSAGVTPRDIVVFDRYRAEFRHAGYPENLPDGVRWDAAVEAFDTAQLDIDGYDRDVYREIDLVSVRYHDPTDERTRRSHLCLIVSRAVNKIVSLPVLKDHSYAGVTLALKNMSHGFVNNVARSHANSATAACNTFIPAIVSMPAIRSKVVLHILDGTKALFDAGPQGSAATVWNNGALYFATDPVALDHIGWETIDAKRQAMGLPLVVDAYARRPDEKPQPSDSHRQPQHIALAAALGLGVFDRVKIDYKRILLAADGSAASLPRVE
jgi:hypothetical protein